MPFKLIKGEFHIHYPDIPRQGPEPDGDTLKFKPDNPQLAELLQQPGRAPSFNKRGMINLRFEGIDALETHFRDMHQKMDRAIDARDFLLDITGFQHVVFYDDLPNKVASVDAHPQRGFILSKEVDPYGRLIAFAFGGDIEFADGRDIHLDEALLIKSFNAQLIAKGMAYPLFYSTLPAELKQVLAILAVEAREIEKGFWQDAATDANKPIRNADDLQEVVMWPKLFRRLASYFNGGNEGLAGFEEWLRSDPLGRDDALLLPNYEVSNMHDVFEVSNNRIRLIYPPEELIILADNTNIPLPPPKPYKAGDVRIIAALINPEGADRGKETVTLLNLTADEISLDDWKMVDNANVEEKLSGKLAAGDTVRVLLGKIRLNNKGDAVTLFDASEKMIDQVQYTRRQTPDEGVTLLF